MLKTFNQFIFEARGYSSTVAEYVELVKKEIFEQTLRYAGFDFKQRYTTFTKKIRLNDAFKRVSQKAAEEFPIDEITISFKIVPIKWKDLGPYSAHYQRNYDKYKMTVDRDERLDITIMCRLNISTNLEDKFNMDILDEYVTDILQHEFTHAFNDYKEPAFLKKYRLGSLADYAIQSYDFIKSSTYLRTFFNLLYVLTDVEIKAIVGERLEFKSIQEFEQFNGTVWAKMGMEYSAEEQYEAIEAELGNLREWQYIDTRFGEIFVELYKEVNTGPEMKIDPKILKLEKSATLFDVLKYFESHINTQGKKLFTKLSGKITQQGEGRLN